MKTAWPLQPMPLVAKRPFWPSVRTMSRPSSSTDLTKTCQALVSTKTSSITGCFGAKIQIHLLDRVTRRTKTSHSGSSGISSFVFLLLHVCFCSRVFIYHVFAGPSKSLTFEEGLVGNGEAGAGTDNEAPKKVPDPCCPIVCERM